MSAWVISGKTVPGQNAILSAIVRKRTSIGTRTNEQAAMSPDIKVILAMISPEGQKAIADYKINGEQLFYPNASDPSV
jgi:ABC-type tungstate transport system permease subunit